MVLELLFNPFSLKKRPWEICAVGFFYSLIAILLSFLVFRDGAGLLMVFLVVLSTLPSLYMLIKKEEELDLHITKEWFLLKEHTKVLVFLMFLFLGITSAFTLAYIFLPQGMVDSLFSLQQQAILNVNKNVHAGLTGGVAKASLLGGIFFNNIKVLFFCLVFSFLYGTGALFILTWNASVVAAAIGYLFKQKIAELAVVSTPLFFGVAFNSFFRYMSHGFFEMASYFVAGLAGGIISIALIKHDLKNDQVLIDSLHLIVISFALLVLAALVEVYITPVFFA